MSNNLRLFLRYQSRNPIYSIISLTGLIIGIVVSFLSYLWIEDELSFDRYHSQSNNIYRILKTDGLGNEINKSTYVYIPLAQAINRDFPQVDKTTFIKYESQTLLQFNETALEIIPAYTDTNFFDIFNGFLFTEGNVKTALSKTKSVVLNETVARKLFGNKPALGGEVKVVSEDEIYVVGGVVRLPKQTHLDFGMITLMSYHSFLNDYFSNNWERIEKSNVYVRIVPNTITAKFQEELKKYISKYKESKEELFLQPLLDIHLHSQSIQMNSDKNIGNYKSIWIFSGLAFFVLIMSVINFLILFMVRSAGRSIEIGIKKINGASGLKIVWQFVIESLFQIVFAAILALIITQLVLPKFNVLVNKSLVLNFYNPIFIGIITVAILIVAVSAILPSLKVSSINPIMILKGKKASHSKNKLVQLLVVLQFVVAIFLIIVAVFLTRQIMFLENKNLGLTAKNIIVLNTGYWQNKSALKEELLKNPVIISVSASVSAPIDYLVKGRYSINNNGIKDSIKASFLAVDEDFANTYQLKINKGEFLNSSDSNPMEEQKKKTNAVNDGKNYTVSIPVVINQTAEKLLGFDNPIGKTFGNYVIKGVVNDFNFESLHHPISPLFMLKFPPATNTLNIRIDSINKPETIKYINSTLMKVNQTSFPSFRFFDDILKEKYQDMVTLRNFSILLSLLAILISVLGILAISIFIIDKQTKEIGIRKVNGAKVSEIMKMLNLGLVKWVVLAFVIATPIAWFAMHKWLENFAYKTELSWWIFALAGLLALGVALLTVSWQSWRAATRNPVEALRYE